jgi:hypothetical protein
MPTLPLSKCLPNPDPNFFLLKITDAGLRSLGNVCHTLSSINISHAKLVSDIGLASLSVGCPKLKSLSCSGVFQLADPRITAGKGAKAASWETVLGVAAVAKHCLEIDRLDLSGCFRLNMGIQRHISCLVKLKVLLLSGCPVSSEAIVAVSQNCPLLTEINLSDCGKGIDGACLKHLASNCKVLQVVCLGKRH